jgi:hypothetical protein
MSDCVRVCMSACVCVCVRVCACFVVCVPPSLCTLRLCIAMCMCVCPALRCQPLSVYPVVTDLVVHQHLHLAAV